jgi:hypothetical protein
MLRLVGLAAVVCGLTLGVASFMGWVSVKSKVTMTQSGKQMLDQGADKAQNTLNSLKEEAREKVKP